jgi:glycosidase
MTTSIKPAMRLLTAAIALACVAGAHAAPDTAVTNKQNFTTDVIYQVLTDRFVDGDSSNNATGAAFDAACSSGTKVYCGGDWQGITNKINDNYLSDMGITAIWVSPPVDNIDAVITYDKPNTAYHGYWARDFKRTNAHYGHFVDFSNMVAAAHAKNIKVIIDFAPNHTSPASSDPAFGENGALFNDGVAMATFNNDVNNTYKFFHHNGSIDDYNVIEKVIYKGLGDLTDIDQNSGAIDTYMKEAIKAWLDLGIDGIRFDAIKHMSFGWQKNFIANINAYKPVYPFGEWMMGDSNPEALNTAFANESGINVLDFRFTRKLRDVLMTGTATWADLDAVISATGNDYKRVIDEVTFLDNHDLDRFQTATNTHRNLEQALALTLTSRGVPCIYYGTEQYMTGGYDAGTNRQRIGTFDKTTKAYLVTKDLATLRKTNPALAYGTTQQRWINNNVYIYERKFGANVVMVAINKDQSNSVSVSNLLTALPNGSYSDVLGAKLSGNGISVSAGAVPTFTLPAGAVSVWQYTAASNSATLGHVGPMMGKAGNTITIDGRGFGATKGTVYFGTTAVSGANIVSWEDSSIVAKVPAVAAGKYGVKVTTAGAVNTNVYPDYKVLTGAQVAVRFVVNGATTAPGENVYLAGSVDELGNWDPTKLIGPLFNQIEYAYPNWYIDVSVPAGTTLQYKFVKVNGSTVTWNPNANQSVTTPASGTYTVTSSW